MTRVKLAAFLIALLAASSPAPARQAAADEDPDRLYQDRENLASAQRAAAIWEQRLQDDSASFESAWKLARITYWLGGHVSADGQRREYERGVAAGRQAIAIAPQRPEGHFWMAANMGALAESFGLRAGMRYRGAIKDALEMVLKIDPAFLEGSADRALGRWYDRVPRLFGGNNTKAVEHLRRSLTYNPDSTISHFFLAEALLDMNRPEEGRAELQAVLDVPLSKDWAPEDREFKQKAQARLEQLD
jgi:tetratricopeptide (TPR) repeat protein